MSEYKSFHGTLPQIIIDCQNINVIDGVVNAIMLSKLNTLYNSLLSSYNFK